MAAPPPFKADQSAKNKGKKQTEKNCKVGHNANTYTSSVLTVMANSSEAHSSGVVFFGWRRKRKAAVAAKFTFDCQR
jgi:hypothetical protein